jgi:hypothetical protein
MFEKWALAQRKKKARKTLEESGKIPQWKLINTF